MRYDVWLCGAGSVTRGQRHAARAAKTVDACYYCGGSPWGDNHAACDEEYKRRVDAGRCTRCGRIDAAPGSLWCRTCDASGSSEFIGYPGGGA